MFVCWTPLWFENLVRRPVPKQKKAKDWPKNWYLVSVALVGFQESCVTPVAKKALVKILFSPSGQVVYESYLPVNLTVPAMPGYLGFREVCSPVAGVALFQEGDY